jgi:hypothetical protein
MGMVDIKIRRKTVLYVGIRNILISKYENNINEAKQNAFENFKTSTTTRYLCCP